MSPRRAARRCRSRARLAATTSPTSLVAREPGYSPASRTDPARRTGALPTARRLARARSGSAPSSLGQAQHRDRRPRSNALANLLYYPTPSVFLGPELQLARRENFRDGFTSDDFRIQFSAKYNFKFSLGGK